MKPFITGLFAMLIALALLWALFAYSSDDLRWPVDALSWRDAAGTWFLPPGLCRAVIFIVATATAFFAFICGALIGEGK